MGYKDRDVNTRDLSEDYMRSVSESELKDRAYTPFELAHHDRESIEEIKRCIKQKKYKDKDTIQQSLEFIEELSNKMNIAVQNEKRDNKTTWELEADLNDLKKIFTELNNLLLAIENGEVNTSEKTERKIRFKTRK
jgi:hypothetical protein